MLVSWRPDLLTDGSADGLGLGRVAVRLLLDDALQHAGDERHAAGTNRLQIHRRQEVRLRGVAPIMCSCWRARRL